MVNKVILIGNVGKDPVIRNINENTPVATFTLATNEVYKDQNGQLQKVTEWHNIVAWRNNAQLAEKFIKKGSQLYIEGRIKSRSYTDKDNQTRYITEIVADKIQLLGKKDDNLTDTTYSTDSTTVNETTTDINTTINQGNPEDDLPF